MAGEIKGRAHIGMYARLFPLLVHGDSTRGANTSSQSMSDAANLLLLGLELLIGEQTLVFHY
jgi:hypothetical protein